ncbi:MAG: SDR family oxidoreductase [Gammaproteobacteria bacterium]|nr:SDR family oxidoreductase [Gammaproteobacteria bacterium]
MYSFKDQIALITGAGSGIGAALSQALAERGAQVICADLLPERAATVVAAIQQAGGTAYAVPLDVRDAEQVEALVKATVARHGRLDFMINNAGISVTGDARDLELAHWRQVLDVNLMGVVYGTHAAYQQMTSQGHGHIVNIASLAGLVPFPTNVPYATTKHAVVGLSLSLRAEAQDLGVRVSAVCPGFIQTNILVDTPVINLDRAKFMRNLPFTPLSPVHAAAQILRGIERNRAIIVFPGYARILWALHRLAALLLNPMHLKAIRDLRKFRGITPPQ